ncbi:MAG: hypothetical protein A4E48_00155 [Methanosaeta sp. PtaU1.Bin060]|nr:MAG: hypothetical protein A4E48_00155 [Methanosaeta sp. PtaU1.Bin060]
MTEPTIIIALVTSIFYTSISGYYIAYFKRLSIPFYTLDLPFTFYLNAGNGILYALYYLIILVSLGGSLEIAVKMYKNGKFDRRDLFWFISGLCIFALLLLFIFNFVKNIFFILFVLLMTIHFYDFIYKKYRNKNYETLTVQNLFIVAFIICISIPSYLGTINADKLIGGDAGSLEVKLDLDNKSPDLLNKTLILVVHSDGKYYLVEKNKSIPKEPNLYIIPDHQIKSIVVKPVKEGQRKFYEFYKDWRIA